MPISVRQFGIASFTALYGVVVLWGYGLHAWAPCQDDACCTEAGDQHAGDQHAGDQHAGDHHAVGHHAVGHHAAAGGSDGEGAVVGRGSSRNERCCGICRHDGSLGQRPKTETHQSPRANETRAADVRSAAGLEWRSCESDHPLDCAICAFLAKLKQSGPAVQDGPECSIPVVSLAPDESSQLLLSPAQAPTARGPPRGQI